MDGEHAKRLRDRAAESRRAAEATGRKFYISLAEAYEALATREELASQRITARRGRSD